MGKAPLLIPWGGGGGGGRLPTLWDHSVVHTAGFPTIYHEQIPQDLSAQPGARMTCCCLGTQLSEFAWLLFLAQLHTQI